MTTDSTETARQTAARGRAESADSVEVFEAVDALHAPIAPADLVSLVAAESAYADAFGHGPGTNADSLAARLGHLTKQLLKFGLVGGVGFVIEFSVFNLLWFTVLNPANVPFGDLTAKIIATLIAIVANWIGNRLWTFRHVRRSDSAREAAEFFGVSLAGLVVGLLPLWVSTYVLGFESALAANIANLIGLALGSLFRFGFYRWWVFHPSRAR